MDLFPIKNVTAQQISPYEDNTQGSGIYIDNNYDFQKYNKFPTDINKYECQKGPFEGFFVATPEFCKLKLPSSEASLRSQDNTGQRGTSGTNGPQGEIGPPGPQGPEGQQGPKGPTGLIGPHGLQGLQGVKGDTGATGMTGKEGLKGDTGTTGMTGPQGERGFNGTQGSPGIVNAEACPVGTLLENVFVTTPTSNAICNLNISGPNVYAVWQDDSLGNNEIFFRVSSNGGLAFSNAINLSNNSATSQKPQISSSGNNVYVVWEDNTLGNTDILFTASNNSGTTFGSSINLSNNSGTSSSPQIFSSGNNVYVVWEDNTLGEQ